MVKASFLSHQNIFTSKPNMAMDVRVRVLRACSVEQKKNQWGAAPPTERESMKETCVREREGCAGSEMRINVRKEQSEGVRVK